MSLLKSRAIDGKSSRGIPHFGGKWEQREYGGGGVPQAKTEQTDAEIVAMEQRLRVRTRATDMYHIPLAFSIHAQEMREAMAGEREKRLQLLNSRKGGNFWAAAGDNYVPKVAA
jgi:hypothetical protein